ncbi:MAG: serine/threonine protein kinase [Phycisphaerales bacterium]|nr:serine/threonine protein kinase [Phycisphaerales bacterium]MCB9858689.1 serine/threonine protein kinase [Phycisphaerales bacterium]MCB9864455.1 serine/threonine protein kinase [Phycisphaerales bacterium]
MTIRWDKIEAAFAEMLESDSGERMAIIDRHCGDDVEMRRRLLAMLESHQRMGEFLEHRAFRGRCSSEGSDRDERFAGRRIGPYEAIRLIGVGGMGVVFEVRGGDPPKHFALKLLNSSVFPGDRVRRAWRHETEMLSRLPHPSIAGFVDAGIADDDAPYIVMEFVDGVPLDQFEWPIDATIHDRIKLMLCVCDAVAFGHQRGVIHRDLKPTNVLVERSRQSARADDVGGPGGKRASTERPLVLHASGIERDEAPAAAAIDVASKLSCRIKIVDFGLALPMSPDERLSVSISIAHRGAGTLAYMSPERIREPEGDADVRGDVYSLGAMLYELLTGRRPHDLADVAYAEAMRRICEEDIERPARLKRELRGDLEAILLKALAAHPADRYQTVNQLADDLKSFLDGRSVNARRAGVAYDIRKFVVRHRSVSVIAFAALAILVSVSLGLAVLYQRTNAAEREARRQAQASKDAMSLLLWVFMVDGPWQGPPGDVTIYQAMKLLVSELDRIDIDPLIEAEMRHRIGVSLRERGEFDEAERNLNIAANLTREHLGPDAPQTANCDVALACLQISSGARPDLGRLERAIDVLRRHAATEEWVRAELAVGLQALAHLHYFRGEYAEAEDPAREALRWMGEPTNGVDAQKRIGLQIDLARILVALKRTDDADAIYEKAYEEATSTLPEDDLLIGSLNEHLASKCLRERDDECAGMHAEAAIRIYEIRLPANHPTIAGGYLLRGHVHRDAGRYEQAKADYERASTMLKTIHGPTARPVLNVEYAMAKCEEAVGDFDAAVDRFTFVLTNMKTQHPELTGLIGRIEEARKQAIQKREAAQLAAAAGD